MKAFIDTVVSKGELLKVLEAHSIADNFTKGQYWEEGKGCAVGCSLESFTGEVSNHGKYERLFGIPRILAQLEDVIFEGLSNKDSKWWPIAFANAIPEGADLTMVWPEFAIWLLTDDDDGVIKFAKTEEQKAAIQKVSDLYSLKLKGEDVSVKEWRDAADAAAVYDAAAAAAATAESVAGSSGAGAGDFTAAAGAASACSAAAADAAADVAAYASTADVAAIGYAAARQKARKRQADKLIELLEKAPIK